jgi:hypothetical protein
VRFFNLFSFARTIYEESAASGFTLLLDDLVPERLLRAILQRHFAGERYLSRALLAPSSILGALHELKAGGVDPGKALAALAEEELGHEDAPKLAEILSLYKRYEDELRRRKFHERSDVVRLAADHAPRSALLGGFKHVLYYGFYDLDQNQLDLLAKSAAACRAPSSSRTSNAGLRVREGLPRDRHRADGGVRPRMPTKRRRRACRSSRLGRPRRSLGRGEGDPPLLRPGIRTTRSASSPARSTRTSTSSSRSSATTRSRTRRAEPQARPRPARQGRPAALHARRLRPRRRARSAPLAVLPEKAGDRELWDQASRLMGIGHGADEWRRRLAPARGRTTSTRSAPRGGRKVRAARVGGRPLLGAVRPLLDAPPPPATGWKAYADWALDRYRALPRARPADRSAIGALSALEGFALEEPREALLDALPDLSEPAGGRAGVRVYDAMAARGSSFRALIVIGMNERVFPRFILQDPFVRDAVRSRIEHRLGNRMARKLQGYDEERLLFTLLQGSATRSSSPPALRRAGRLQIPSSFLPPEDPSASRGGRRCASSRRTSSS